ncbi:hypothetical protein [Bifidobacterium avesanii]|nr:hypothetical protein [Bifidobacterium avesanii]KAB8293643.1 hypothetical protein DSM100685_0711 [Bifidobacterium avesanii]
MTAMEDDDVRLERAPHVMTADEAIAEVRRLRAMVSPDTALTTMTPVGLKEELSKRGEESI